MEVFCKTFTLVQRRCFSVNFAEFLRAVFKLFMTVYVAYANAMYIAFSRLKLGFCDINLPWKIIALFIVRQASLIYLKFALFSLVVFCHRFLWIYSYHSAGSNVPAQSLNNICHYNYKKKKIENPYYGNF